MPNPDHLAILKDGVEVWNQWREENPEVVPDLCRSRLQGDLLRNAALTNANLAKANLREANLSESDLRGANLRGANLTEADLSEANLRGAILSEANLTRTILIRVSLANADLTRAILYQANLTKAFLRQANLRDSRLTEANLARADLQDADLSRALLVRANLNRADLARVNLFRANLTGADLIGVILYDTSIPNATLADAKNLSDCRHRGPSTLDGRTLAQSPNLPLEFLRGCGLSDFEIEIAKLYRVDLSEHQITDITYRLYELRSEGAIQFHSCFISYSNVNAAFARQLYQDLQAQGVRCWFDKEDLKIGSRIRPAIHDAIRFHDKLLLILSEHSVLSQWVEDEVENALEKERRDGSTVLFPIRVDDALTKLHESDDPEKEKARAWATYLKNTRHIGDFRQWEDHDAYQTAFNRLLRDLRDS